MGIKDFFKRKKKENEVYQELTLDKIKEGCFVDYDLQTWEVVAANYYDWGNNDISYEWQLKNSVETVYLEMEYDDEKTWSLNRKISFANLGKNVGEHIIKNQDPPDEIIYNNKKYYLEETAGGHFFKNKNDAGKEVLRWSYEDEGCENFLGIEQWGEEDFDASKGIPVQEYQFTNILMGE